MDIQQLRQSLKMKWVSYYYKNRSWLVKMQIWATYDGQRRPCSGFILATLSVLEPQLEQIFPFILELNNNPDKIISALGLNFNPEEQSNLIKSDNFRADNHVSSQSSLDTLVSEKPSSEYIRDRTRTDSAATTEIQIEDNPKPSVTPVTEDCSDSPASLPRKPMESIAVATKVQNKSNPLIPFAVSTKGESNSVVPLTIGTVVQNKSKPLASVATATVVENKGKLARQIAVATREESNSVVQLALFPEIESQSDSVIPIAVANAVESKNKLVNMKHKDFPDKVHLSPANKACKLANWIDDFCQGTEWDREEAIFIPF